MIPIELRKQKYRQYHMRGIEFDNEAIFHVNTLLNQPFYRDFNPFIVGPCKITGWPLDEPMFSENMENAWQFSKVYKDHTGPDDSPTQAHYQWASEGFRNPKAQRRPMGRKKPLYSLWDGENLGYIEARKKIYWPLYRDAVVKTKSWNKLRGMALGMSIDPGDLVDRLVIWDYDVRDTVIERYENNHGAIITPGFSFSDIINDEKHLMGHGYVLAAMLIYGPKITPEEILQRDA